MLAATAYSPCHSLRSVSLTTGDAPVEKRAAHPSRFRVPPHLPPCVRSRRPVVGTATFRETRRTSYPRAVRIALVDSGLGMLSTAAALRAARPDADLVLSMDPDHMPWGPRTPDDVIGRALAGAQAAMNPPPAAGSTGPAGPAPRPDAVVVPCNTASVHGLSALRSEFEPGIPVVGTVPPIKPAAEAGSPIAVWATAATTHSRYQNSLIASFAPETAVTQVACVGLAEAVEKADRRAIAEAVRRAAEHTPDDTTGVVLGCTHYDLVDASISAALGAGVPLFTAADAVAAQALRRIGTLPDHNAPPTGSTVVLASGRTTELPTTALRYAAGATLLRSGGAVSS